MKIKSLSRDQWNYPITSLARVREIDYIGNIELFNTPMVAVFSSAKCPGSLILKAHDYAKDLREGETGIIGGFHAPAEKEILAVLLKGTCPIVVVLGCRLENSRIPSRLSESSVSRENSQFEPLRALRTRSLKGFLGVLRGLRGKKCRSLRFSDKLLGRGWKKLTKEDC